MRSIDGLELDQIGRWRDVLGSGYDTDLGPGRLVPGSPPVFRPVDRGQRGGTPPPWGGWLRWMPWPLGRAQDLGPARITGAPGGPAPRGFPPTAPPAGASAAQIPPAWAVRVAPDDELRNGSPSLGRY